MRTVIIAITLASTNAFALTTGKSYYCENGAQLFVESEKAGTYSARGRAGRQLREVTIVRKKNGAGLFYSSDGELIVRFRNLPRQTVELNYGDDYRVNCR